MNARSQITLDTETQRRAQAKAAEIGISFAEYVRRLVAEDLGPAKQRADVSALFDLVDDGPVTDIAREKDKMIGEAVAQMHRRKYGRSDGRRRRAGTPGR